LLQYYGYSFETKDQLNTYSPKVNGMFSNKANEALVFYKKGNLNAEKVLKGLGY
jgi:hypothetical protein